MTRPDFCPKKLTPGEQISMPHVLQTAGRVLMLAFLAGAAIADLAVPALAQTRQYSADQIQAGYRLYGEQCQICHSATGDGIAGINLSRQQFHTVVSDDDIRRMIGSGNPQGMPPFVFRPEELDDLVAFIRSGLDPGGVSFALGDVARGKASFDANGCASCHRVLGSGARTAPDLTDIGFVRRPGQILTSLTDPGKATMPINRPVTLVTRDGRTITGRRYNEDTFIIQLIDSQERLITIAKSDVRRYTVGQETAMPSYRGKLADSELADLLAYLVSLKG
jgi:putative heme-binding domain-containing protein